MAKKVRIILSRSLIGQTEKIRRTIRALGLGKVGSSALHTPTASFTGMVRKVKHLIRVEES